MKLPLPPLVLDAIGVVLPGLGIEEYFVNIRIVSERFRFDKTAVVMMLSGRMLMMPMIVWIFYHLLSKQETKKNRVKMITPKFLILRIWLSEKKSP